MRFLKHWRSLLIILLCIAVGGIARGYVRSPGYRAAQAFARIQQGMTEKEAVGVLRQFGGEIMAWSSTGVRLEKPVDVDVGFWFGDRCYVYLIFPAESPAGEPQLLKGKRLSRPSFSEWLSRLLCSIKSGPQAYESDPSERMQELLNESENLCAVSDEWKRWWEIEQPTPSSRPRE
jgi:hypothetical protein